MKSEDDPYVGKLLALYLALPQTPYRTIREDRRLAGQLLQRNLPLELIEAAFLLASARRLFRAPDLPPLAPIRSMHYFLPVIEEVLATGVSPDYVNYLRGKIASLSARPSDRP